MLQNIARLLLKLGGWTTVGGQLTIPKAVVIAAPHTSNWDAYWAIVYIVATGNDFRLFAKQSLFWFPLGAVLRRFGCVPLDRSKATSVVRQAIEMFEKNDRFHLALAPEGTRGRATGWKSGFYRIAKGANVPVMLGMMDYQSRRLGIGGRLDLSDDIEADRKALEDYYADIQGYHPENASPVKFRGK